MQYIFLPPEQFEESLKERQKEGQDGRPGRLRIEGGDHQHLAKVLRARVGDKIVALDGRGNAYRATLVTIDRHATLAEIEAEIPMPPEPPIHLTVAQALGKGDKFEEVVQHGTEAGASAFLPIHAERCVVDLPATRVPDRISRWQQIAKGAAEQSRRALVPTVEAPIRASALFALQPAQTLLLHPVASAIPLARILGSYDILPKHNIDGDAQENSDNGVDARLTSKSAPHPIPHLILAIGPEGGWSQSEVSQAEKANIPCVSLGPRVLRTETAALVAISQILYHFEAYLLKPIFENEPENGSKNCFNIYF